MSLKRSGLVLAGLLVIALVVMVAPVWATRVTLNPGDSIQGAMNNASAGDAIVLNPGTYNQNGITVSKEITLEANTSAGGSPANTIIDAQGKWMFSSNSNSFVVDNLSLKNGCGGYGGAINAAGDLTILHSTFTHFKASLPSSWGGAVYVKGALALDSSTFTDCWANQGGAIYSEHGGTIVNSTFSGCSSGWGGAIDSPNDQPLTVSGSSFNNCSATTYSYSSGGAIYSERATVDNSTFTGCTAIDIGGAIDSEHGGTIVNSTFTRCSANYGGAIDSASDQPLSVSGSTFNDCKGTNTITYSNEGGAINAGGAITIDESTFSDCSAQQGGAIYSEHGVTSIVNSTFNNCLARWGGAIDSVGDQLITVSGSSFTGCTATDKGGAIYSEHGGTIVNSTFNNCNAEYGGGIHSRGDLTVSGSTFTGCVSPDFLGSGGGIHALGDLTVSGSSFNGCSALAGGGIKSDGETHVDNSTFSTCTARYGGGIFSLHALWIHNSSFSKCMADLGEAINAYAALSPDPSTLSNLHGCSIALDGKPYDIPKDIGINSTTS
jgi:predicted outer membrane repeat protein